MQQDKVIVVHEKTTGQRREFMIMRRWRSLRFLRRRGEAVLFSFMSKQGAPETIEVSECYADVVAQVRTWPPAQARPARVG